MTPRRIVSNGFTLVEMLVVTTIVVLLISLLLPALRNARESAKLVKCMSGVRQVGIGTANYGSDFRGYFPNPNYPGSWVFAVGGLGAQKTLVDGGYVSSKIWHNQGGCPDGPVSAQYYASGPKDYSDRIGYNRYTGPQGEVTYGLNSVLVYGLVNSAPGPGTFRDTFRRLQRRPDLVMAAACCSNIEAAEYFGVQLQHTMGIPDFQGYLSLAELTSNGQFPRHLGKGFNVYFYDGHTSYKPASELVPASNYPTVLSTPIAWLQWSMSWYDLSAAGIDH